MPYKELLEYARVVGPFNSLFEMLKYFGVVYVECFFGLSILYLRCTELLRCAQ